MVCSVQQEGTFTGQSERRLREREVNRHGGVKLCSFDEGSL